MVHYDFMPDADCVLGMQHKGTNTRMTTTKPKKLRLLYVLSEFMYGSKIRQLCDLVDGLDKNAFDIEVCAFEIDNEAAKEVVLLGVPHFQLRLQPPRSLDAGRFIQFLRSPYLLRSRNYDLVHSLCYQSIFVEPLIVKTFSKAKYIYTKSNLEWENHSLNWHVKSKLSDRVVSISRATDELLVAKGFGGKTSTIYLGIDTNVFSPRIDTTLRKIHGVPDDAIVFGCAAQFVEWKEHLSLIKAFDKLAQANPDIYLFLCGPNHGDSFYQTVLQTIKDSAHADRIKLLGTLDDMPTFYVNIDCFVLPSRNETFGYVYVEAMSCGKPVIACRAAGPLDIIQHGETGYFVEMSNYVDLAEKMENYLTSKPTIALHGDAARARVLQVFSKQAMVQAHQALYYDLLG
jgi:glycosyltransferase involved in cell wall biosynthesis